MKNLRKILFVFIVVFSLLFLANCKKKEFYSLDIPEHITVDVSDLTKIKKNTKITLTITYPEGKELDFLKVNDDIVEVTNDKYTFKIVQDTIVKLTLKNIGDVGVELFELTLPEGVKANITNLGSIEKGTSITLTITPPKNHELDKLYVNDVVVSVIDNSYTFVLQKDTVVIVEWFSLDGWKPFSKKEVYNFFEGFNYSMYHKGTFTTNERFIFNDEEMDIMTSLVEVDEDLMPVKFLQFNGDDINDLGYFFHQAYFDGEILVTDQSEVGIRGQYHKSKHFPGVFSIVEFIISGDIYGETNTYVPKEVNLLTIDFMNYIAQTAGSKSALFDKVKIYKKDEVIRVNADLSSEDLILISQSFGNLGEWFTNSTVEFELIINDSKIEEFSFMHSKEFREDYHYNLKYESIEIEEPLFYVEYNKGLIEEHFPVEIIIDGKSTEYSMRRPYQYLFDDEGNVGDYIIKEFGIYKEGFGVEGYYINSNFSTKADPSNFTGKLYVKWEPLLSFTELFEKFVPEGKLYLGSSVYGFDYYYENDDYILKSGGHADYFYDKKNDITYTYSSYDNQLHYAVESDVVSLRDSIENSNYFMSNGVYFDFYHTFIINQSYIEVFVEDHMPYFFVPVKNTTEIDNLITSVAALIPEAIETEISDVIFYSYNFESVFEINDFKSKINIGISYSSGEYKSYESLEEAIYKGAIEVNVRLEGTKHRVFVLIDDQEFELEQFLFYDETMGIYVYAYNAIDTYLHLIEDLPELDLFEPTLFVKEAFYGLRISEDIYYKFYNVEELKAYDGDLKYLYLSYNEVPIDIDELNILLGTQYNLEYETSQYLFRYEYVTNTFTVKIKQSPFNQFNVKVFGDEIYIWDEVETLMFNFENEGININLIKAKFNFGSLSDKIIYQLLEFGLFTHKVYEEVDPIFDPGYYNLGNNFVVRIYRDYIYLGDRYGGPINWKFTTNPVEYPERP